MFDSGAVLFRGAVSHFGIDIEIFFFERDKTLSAAEKRERLSDLEDRRDRLARRAL
jgi:hypothetical protein